MESLVHNVKDMALEARRGWEAALGATLHDNQRIYVVVLTLGVEPTDQQRAAALADLRELGERGATHRESLGVTADEADQALDEAIDTVRARRDGPRGSCSIRISWPARHTV